MSRSDRRTPTIGVEGVRPRVHAQSTHKIKTWKPRFRRADPEQANVTDNTDETTTKSELSGFLLVPVADVSQLQGNPQAARPAPPQPIELSGDAPTGLWDGIAAQIVTRGFRVERGDCDGVYGQTHWGERLVTVRADVEPAQAAKTLTHELAHILCDHETRTVPRSLREVEAESVACVVAAICGLDTLQYSVPYVAGWASDRDTARQSAERVLAVADAILEQLNQVPTSTRRPMTSAIRATQMSMRVRCRLPDAVGSGLIGEVDQETRIVNSDTVRDRGQRLVPTSTM